MPATSNPYADVRLGGVRFSVHDDSRPVAGATCSLYRVLAAAAPAKKSAEKATDSSATGDGTARYEYVASATTGLDGRGEFAPQPEGPYRVVCHHEPRPEPQAVTVEAGCTREACIDLGLDVSASFTLQRDCAPIDCAQACSGDQAELRVDWANSDTLDLAVRHPGSARVDPNDPRASRVVLAAGVQQFRFTVLSPYVAGAAGAPVQGPAAHVPVALAIDVGERTPQPISGNLGVALSRTATAPTADVSFWQGILNSTEQMSFNNYLRFMNLLFCGENDLGDLPEFERQRFDQKRALRNRLRTRRLLPFTDSDAYRVIKAATEAFVMVNCGVLAPPRPFDDVRDADYLRRRDLPVPAGRLEDVFTEDYLVQVLGGAAGDKTLPYLAVIRSKLPDISIKLNPLDDVDAVRVGQCTGILQEKLTNPCLLELIWSYWHEEGMLAQTMNAITRRFQNVRTSARDPLANLEIDPLRPLNNVLWGFVQDEQHRLSVVRRNYEYDHHYGLRLEGRAVQNMRPADSRSRFIEAFHNLLRLAAVFFKQDDDTTVKADAFPVLNALKEVHLILSQGAHNQFGDLPSTARIEMLMEQWLLARPELREFLPTRIMTAYPEPWMDRVDAMKKLQGWSDASVLHFRNLAIFGEQVLLSIRWGHWSDVQEPLQAFNWLRFFRPQIQGYAHAYRAVTGVDLTVETADKRVDATLPSVLLQRRLSVQQRTA